MENLILEEFRRDYSDLVLAALLTDGDAEGTLTSAYELGRTAYTEGVRLPQVAEAHNATLLDACETGMETPKRTIEVESQCFLELIGGYSLILPPFASEN